MASDKKYIAFSINSKYSHHYAAGGDMQLIDQPGYGMHGFYLGDVRLPVAPKSFKVTIDNKNETVDLASGGAYKVINEPGLTSYQFEFYIPHDENSMPWAVYEYGYKSPQFYFEYLEDLKTFETKTDRIFQFMVIEDKPNPTIISVPCTLEDYSIEQDADNGLDYVVSVKLERYDVHLTESFELIAQDDGSYVAVASTDVEEYKLTHKKIDDSSLKEYKSGTHEYNMAAAATALVGMDLSTQDIIALAKYNGASVSDIIPIGEVLKL